ncbi:tolloid-like protein 2, partial [Limulus polyphemus]|uniref:Tolloid-like protein 2 n=1 Tax=Limulus polyphemus TaxID=6850 RepID=A0ABM1C475_LIMPO
QFTDFELEPHQECTYDHIAIYDGENADSSTLGRFCGSKVPHPILASSNRMYMIFTSDASVQRKGFKATHSTVCGGRLVALPSVEHLYSHSKYGDQNYDNKEDCDWIIQSEEGTGVRLRFLTFEIEHEQDCGYDFVEVYDGYDDSAPHLGHFCGNKLPPEFVSTGNSLLLRFRSDDTINVKGFSAAYLTVRDVGGGEEMVHKNKSLLQN